VDEDRATDLPAAALSESAERVLTRLRSHGASFAADLSSACGIDEGELRTALRDLVAAGCVSSDGFAGLRAIVEHAPVREAGRLRGFDHAGRWFALRRAEGAGGDVAERADALTTIAWVLLHRYGVVFRRLLARETSGVTWRELARIYRRLEARGEIRGGRFVSGVSGEQFALPEAVERLREVRRSDPDGRLITISAADPLNLTGVLSADDRVRAAASTRLVYRNGVAIMAMEGDLLRPLTSMDPELARDAAAAAAGRRVPVVTGYVGRISG
jgi:ATP-dependent Lhr-like helicase